MKECPCGSKLNFLNCCGLYLHEKSKANTAEALMRSRYTAYTLSNIPYIKKTMQGKALHGFDEQAAEHWSKSIYWLGLKILKAHQDENNGVVEFVAEFLDKNWIKSIHEESQFQRLNGNWFYVDGKQVHVPSTKISRNSLCPCGSKKKFKNCHECR